MRRAPHTPPLVALDLHDVVADGEPDASGFPWPGAVRYAAWNVRKAAKFAGGPTSLRVRQLLLAGAR